MDDCSEGWCVALPLLVWVLINTGFVLVGSLLVTYGEVRAPGDVRRGKNMWPRKYLAASRVLDRDSAATASARLLLTLSPANVINFRKLNSSEKY